jgi:hypothetical protein
LYESSPKQNRKTYPYELILTRMFGISHRSTGGQCVVAQLATAIVIVVNTSMGRP